MTNRRRRLAMPRLTTLEDRTTPAALLPDLHALPGQLSGWTVATVNGGRELRYSTALANGGQGAFDLRGTPSYVTGPDGVQRQLVNQRVYQSEGGFQDRQAGFFVYHPTHGHVHFDDMAFGIIRQRTAGNGLGDIVALGPKTSFFLLDATRYNASLPGSPTSAQYGTPGQVQGISVGWADVYGSGLDGQQINITGVANGDYWLEVTVDPLNAIQETDDTNNTTRIAITLTGQPSSGFRIFQATPLGLTNNPVSYAEVDFSQPVDPATFTPSDVTFNRGTTSVPITSITAVTSTKFRVNFATQGAISTYTMNIGPDIRTTTGTLLDSNNNGVGGEAADTFGMIFSIPAPRVSGVTPSGAIAAPFSTVRISFNKPVLSSSFTTTDVGTFTGPGGTDLRSQITGIVPVTAGTSSTEFDINFTAQTALGAYQMVIEPTIQDLFGNSIDSNGDGVSNSADRYTANFSISPVGIAGPDTFGYSGRTKPTQNLELVGQSNTFTPGVFSSTDDGSSVLALGTNTFNFHGTTYSGSQLYVSTNGLISFGAAETAYENNDMAGLTVPAIAVLWDDWVLGSGTPQVLAKFFDDNGDAINDRLVIEWNQIYHYSSSPQGATFQAVLQLNTGTSPGNIFLNYPDLLTGDGNAGGVSATVGLRSPTGVRLLISQDGSSNLVGNAKAIEISVPKVQSIALVDPNPVTTNEGEFLVTFNHPVTGVDIADFTLVTTGTLAGGYIDHIHATANPAVYEVHVRTGYGNGTAKINLIDNGTIVDEVGAPIGGTGTANGNFTTGPTYTVVQQAPRVFGVNIGDGTAQRSMVKKLQVIFDSPVQFTGGNTQAFQAFAVVGPNGPVAVTVDLSLSTPIQTTAVLTFTGTGTEFGSLADGRYTLTVLGSRITTGGVNLDGDGNGTAGGDSVTQFHRLFGDANGDASISGGDFGLFRLAFGTALGDPNYVDYFDYDGNGSVSGVDFGNFRTRFGTTLP